MTSEKLFFLLRINLIFVDIVIVNGAYLITYNLFHLSDTIDYAFFHRIAILNLLWFVSSFSFKLYANTDQKIVEIIFRRSIRVFALYVLFVVIYYFYISNRFLSLSYFIYFLIGTLIGLALIRFLLTGVEAFLRRKYVKRISVAIIGSNNTGIQLAKHFIRLPYEYRFHGIIDVQNELMNEADLCLHYQTEIARLNSLGVKEIFISLPVKKYSLANDLIRYGDSFCIKTKVLPDVFEKELNASPRILSSGIPVIEKRIEPLSSIHNRVKKRFFDVVFSFLVIALLLSWLIPIIALVIKVNSKGPIFFKQQRSGRDNVPFYCLKFRTMFVNDESDSKQATKNDSRITSVGKFLRRTSLDELPQFINVLKGEMSVVGPRPHMLSHTEAYRKIIDDFMVRHYLKPGITGWAQINGLRGETKHPDQMQKRVEADIYYLENWNLMMDLKIVFITIFLTISGDEAAF